jgi:amino acid transporter
LTVLVILALALVNVRGVRWGGVLQLFITTVKVGSLLGILVLPFVAARLAGAGSGVPSPDPSLLTPVWPSALSQLNLAGFGTALIGVLFAYHGWMNIAPVAEEVKEPQRNLPLALFAGVGVVLFLYLGANLAYSLVLPRTEMAGLRDTTVATAFSLRLLGPIGAAAASAAVMCSVFGAINGNMLVGPRMLYAMGEDGLAPRALGSVNARYRTPAVAILVMGGWAATLVVLAATLTRHRLPVVNLGIYHVDLNVPSDKSLFDLLTSFAMFGAVSFETLAVATIFVFRQRYPHAQRPYRCWGYPVVPALYVVIMAVVLASMFWNQQIEALVGVGFIVLGAAVYYLCFKPPADLPSTLSAPGG